MIKEKFKMHTYNEPHQVVVTSISIINPNNGSRINPVSPMKYALE